MFGSRSGAAFFKNPFVPDDPASCVTAHNAPDPSCSATPFADFMEFNKTLSSPSSPRPQRYPPLYLPSTVPNFMVCYVDTLVLCRPVYWLRHRLLHTHLDRA